MPGFNPARDIPSLAGKVCLVTGATSGIGEATVTALAQHNPDKIYLGCRSKSKAVTVLERIRATSAEARSANIDILEIDLASFDSVKTAAERVNREVSRLDILHLNGGIAAVQPETTADGYELQFGTNYMGHALLTQLLMPKLLETSILPGADVRIIAISSAFHKLTHPKGGIAFNELKSSMDKAGGLPRYGQSMLAKILFAREMAKQYPSIKSVAVHPGPVKTPLYDVNSDINWFLVNLVIKPMLAINGTTKEEGAKTQLWSSVSNDVVSGTYYEPIGKGGKESELAKDPDLATKLWDWTNKELLSNGAPGWPKA